MKRFLFLIIIISVIIPIIYQPAKATLGNNLTAGEVVAQAFAASNAELSRINVQSFAKVDDNYLSIAALTDLGWLVAKAFNEENMWPEIPDWHVASGEAAGQRQVELSTNIQSGEISILLQSLATGEEELKGETFLIVTMVTNPDIDVVRLEYQATNVFAPFQLIPRLSVLYTGQVTARYDQQGKSELMAKMLTAVQGKKVEGIEEDFLVSYSSYTPLIANTWWTGSKEINLQIGIRDHSEQNSTMIYVGYPLILTGY